MAISYINGPGSRYTPGGDMDLPDDGDPCYFALSDIPLAERLHIAETVHTIAELLPRRLHLSRDEQRPENLEITGEVKRQIKMVLTGCWLAGVYGSWDRDFIVPAAQHSFQHHDWSELWTVVLYVVRLAPMEELEQARLIGSIQAAKTVMDTAQHEAHRRMKWAEECARDDIFSGFAFEPFRYIDITDDETLPKRAAVYSLNIPSFPQQTTIRED